MNSWYLGSSAGSNSSLIISWGLSITNDPLRPRKNITSQLGRLSIKETPEKCSPLIRNREPAPILTFSRSKQFIRRYRSLSSLSLLSTQCLVWLPLDQALKENFGTWEMVNSPRDTQALEDLSGWTICDYVDYLQLYVSCFSILDFLFQLKINLFWSPL